MLVITSIKQLDKLEVEEWYSVAISVGCGILTKTVSEVRMLSLFLAIFSSAMIAVVMRLSTGRVKARFSMLAVILAALILLNL